MIKLSRRQAAQIAIRAQMLGSNSRRRATPEDVRAVADRLALIQIDTIHVVARSQYIIPWSRLGSYEPEWLDQLHYPGREMFEYWGHAASLISTDLMPCFFSRMRERREMYHPDTYEWTRENLELIDHVLERVRNEGPLSTLAFERPTSDRPVEPWEWYGGKPTTQVLDYLWMTGQASIHRRVNFRREYDLFDRVHPEAAEMPLIDELEERRTLADRALSAMGISRPEWLNDYFRTKWGFRTNRPPGPRQLLEALVTDDRAIPVEIEGLGDAFVASDQADALEDVLSGYTSTRTTLLSPFDNLIWDRQRTEELFGFEYRIECYTPAAKRKYGYFTLPILRRGRLVGRVDPKVERKSQTFIVKSLHLEPGVAVSQRLIDDLRGTLHAFARWNGATTLESATVDPVIADAINGPVG